MSEESKPTEVKTPQPENSPVLERKKMALWKKVLIGVVVFVVAIIAFAYFGTRGASKAGNDFVEDLQSGRCGAIYERTSDEFRAEGTREQWAEACERISPILQGEAKQRNVEISSSTGNNQTAEVAYEIVGTDGETYLVTLQMVNRDEIWQLKGFDSSKQ